jgi:tetratricopeptide (TPR) repeat protein
LAILARARIKNEGTERVLRKTYFKPAMVNYMLKSTLIILLGTSGLYLQAQTTLDSLYLVWQDHSQDDSTRVLAFKDYIWKEFLFSNPDTAFVLAEELLAFGAEHNSPIARASAYNIQGVSWHIRGGFPWALEFFTKSLQTFEQISHQPGIAGALNNIGLIHKEQGDYTKALDYYIRGLSIKEQIGDQRKIAGSLKNIGNIYIRLGEYTQALDYNTGGLNISEQIGDHLGIAASLNNIGVIYELLGDYPTAIEYHKQGLIIAEQISNQRRIGR